MPLCNNRSWLVESFSCAAFKKHSQSVIWWPLLVQGISQLEYVNLPRTVHWGTFSSYSCFQQCSTVEVLWYLWAMHNCFKWHLLWFCFLCFPSINSKATQRTQMINIGARNVKSLSQGWKNWSIINIFHLIRKVRKMSHRWTPTMLVCYNSSNCFCSCRSWANSNNTTTTRQFYLHRWSMWSIVCVL